MRHTRILALSLLLSFSPGVLASEGSVNVSSACATLEFMGKMLALDTMLPADFDDVGEINVMDGSLIPNDLYHQA
jgi:hypothetical protein